MSYKTKVFFDAEFTGLHKTADLISIGMVSTNGYEFYAEFTDYSILKTSRWVRKNVIGNLLPSKNEFKDIGCLCNDNPFIYRGMRKYISRMLRRYFLRVGACEMWGDVPQYDWVLFCDLFGGAEHLPKNVYYIPFDIATVMRAVGVDPDIDRYEFLGIEADDTLTHNAAWDAKIARDCYRKLSLEGLWRRS